MIRDLQVSLKDKVHQFIKDAKSTLKKYDEEVASQDLGFDEDQLREEEEDTKISPFVQNINSNDVSKDEIGKQLDMSEEENEEE